MHEVLTLSRERVLETVQRQFESPLLTAHAVHAAELQVAVNRQLGEMVTLAINTGVRAGHDRLHTFRVRFLAELFARSEGWEDARVQGLGLAAQLCDIGMQVLPDELLLKARGLSAGERKLVTEHTTFGAEILTRARLAAFQPCVAVAKFHHERWDGDGPHALVGEGIPVEARITALVDALDAMLHARPWRPALTMPAALRLIADGAGTAFDPRLAERFVAFVQREYWKADSWDAHLAQDAEERGFLLARMQISRLIRNER
jgi:HD-GYP domain-containing protein (c-di-GMP phosphodiesterase class II)